MKVPTAGGDDRIVKLYGLKQSGELWIKKIHTILANLGFSRTTSDPCLYTRLRGKDGTYVALYVDDLLITGTQARQPICSLS
jgi:Reverse transcriptase (RNA-dependent DNA polymerase)